MTPAWLRDLGGADPYQLLGVEHDAATADIARAYRRRIRELHPDRETGDAEQARLVNLAREVLLDPLRRSEYDQLTEQPAEPEPPSSAWDTEDVVIGVVQPPSAWDAEDVVLDAEPPPPNLDPEPADWSYQPDYAYQSQYYDPPSYQPYPVYPTVPQPSHGLAIAALVCSLFCWPVGLILGIVALRRYWYVGGSGKSLAIAAVALSAVSLVLICLCYGGVLVSQPSGAT
jgi:hypothetical protein